ncbi:riboflavin synthase [Pontibacillus litoralis]|uniref:Riboflavin synthase n=1 Tax=Pontibacillus litoralis JSM 072002 TaxID=1385512 RepID=A0A0A5G250_9BACI|nr:riboflavin synthase [Pontibacillus litoralis]KGX87176.1 riboflavin synthase subunit alpha [Pontibacillus litoralis JSM 072002]
MFTGIVEEIGTLKRINVGAQSLELVISARKIVEDIQLGDSISINGVCLTVTSFSSQEAHFDVMPETYHASNLHELKQGDQVNLERAMQAGGRFGGHIVSGHVDGVGVITSKQQTENAVYYEIELDAELMDYFVYKGSVAVDGTSLTVFGVNDQSITISLIPHTLQYSIVGGKLVGDRVNIEVDMMGKYVVQTISNQMKSPMKKQQTITASFLEENGFK